MRKIALFVGLMLIAISATANKDIPTKEKTIEKKFGEIRADIVRQVCSVFGYDNSDVICKINYKELISFHSALKQDSTNIQAKTLSNILGNVPPISIDGNVINCKNAVLSYLSTVQENCKNVDTLWVHDIRVTTQRLYEECIFYNECETINDFTEYTKIYNNGIFSALIDHRKKRDADTAEMSNVQDFSFKWWFLIIPALCVLLCLSYFRRKRIHPELTTEELNMTAIDNPNNSAEPLIKSSESASDTATILSPVMPTQPAESHSAEKDADPPIWVIVGASVKGNGHIQSNMPCQDNNRFESIDAGWGIAVVSDGAGSAAHSEVGSKVITERCIFHFKNLIEKEGWMKNKVLPTDTDWLLKSYYTLKLVRDEVLMIANKNNIEPKSLSATCLVVIYSPLGLLAVHIGDGRMGYKSLSGEWKAMMTPHKGDEANQTIFLISDFWTIPNYIMSGVMVPESIVIREPVKAFVLMSDGCENTAWECTIQNPETGKCYDRNKPFEGFFNPLEDTLTSLYNDKVPENEIQIKWSKFIESGTGGFIKEQDDKTMIYGINMHL